MRRRKFHLSNPGIMLAATGAIASAAGKMVPCVVQVPPSLAAEKSHGVAIGRWERMLRRCIPGEYGLHPKPTLEQRLVGLFGWRGKMIAQRAAEEASGGSRGPQPTTVAFAVTSNGIQPVSPECVSKMREDRRDFTSVVVDHGGATAMRYVGGKLASQGITPAVIRFDEFGEMAGAIWYDAGRPRRSSGLTGELRTGFNPSAWAARIAETTSRRGSAHQLRTVRRDINIDTLAWEASQLASALDRVGGTHAEPARRCAKLLSDIARHAHSLHAVGTARLELDVGDHYPSQRDLENLRDQLRVAFRASAEFRRYRAGWPTAGNFRSNRW